jgi:hypothetical protein
MFFRNIPEFRSCIGFDILPGYERAPLMPLGARSGEYGGWVMTGIAPQQAMCGSLRYRDAETTVPACHL